jgi:hypothetical protein
MCTACALPHRCEIAASCAACARARHEHVACRAVQVGRAALQLLEVVPGLSVWQLLMRDWEGRDVNQIGRQPPLSSNKAASHFPRLKEATGAPPGGRQAAHRHRPAPSHLDQPLARIGRLLASLGRLGQLPLSASGSLDQWAEGLGHTSHTEGAPGTRSSSRRQLQAYAPGASYRHMLQAPATGICSRRQLQAYSYAPLHTPGASYRHMLQAPATGICSRRQLQAYSYAPLHTGVPYDRMLFFDDCNW